MSEDIIGAGRRRKRARRLRVCSFLILAVAVILPLAASACVLVEVFNLRKTLEDVAAQVDSLAQVTAGQQELLEQLRGKVQALEQKAAEESSSGQQLGQQTSGRQPSEGTVPVQGDTVKPQETAEITAAHKVYLTFDDGPSKYTQDALRQVWDCGIHS